MTAPSHLHTASAGATLRRRHGPKLAPTSPIVRNRLYSRLCLQVHAASFQLASEDQVFQAQRKLDAGLFHSLCLPFRPVQPVAAEVTQ